MLAFSAVFTVLCFVLVPCNPVGSKHSFLIAVFSQEKWMTALNSKAGAFIVSQQQRQHAKNVELTAKGWYWLWFDFGKPTSWPPTATVANSRDWGVFACPSIYAWWLVTKAIMLSEINIAFLISASLWSWSSPTRFYFLHHHATLRSTNKNADD